jgi:PAS domain S-box-containing protein
MKTSPVTESTADPKGGVYHTKTLEVVERTEFNGIVDLAAQICDCPVSFVGFPSGEGVRLQSKLGLRKSYIPKYSDFFPALSQSGDVVTIEDTQKEGRLSNDMLYIGTKGVRFFACVAIIDSESSTMGYLCVMDFKPRTLTEKQLTGLKTLGFQAETLLEMEAEILVLKKADGINDNKLVNAFFQNAIDAVIVLDDKGIVLKWNPKAETIFGWKHSEVIGKYFHKLCLQQGSWTNYFNFLSSKDKDPKMSESIEISALRKNKSTLDIALGISHATISGKQYYIGFASDVTDRRLVSSKLDQQKEFYENILNSLPTDIVVFDPNHRYIFANPGAVKDEELRKHIIGKDDFEYAEFRNRDKSIAQKRREQFLEIKNSSKEIRWEDTIKDPNGHPITHLRRLFPVYNDKRELTMVIGFGIDITERKLLEVKQAALVEQLSAQNTQLVDFCNIVSHNLRAPLANMTMLANFIEQSTDEAEKKLLVSKLNPVIENLHLTFNELVESIQIKQDLEVKSEKILLGDCFERTIAGLELEIIKSAALFKTSFEAAPVVYYPPKYLFSIFHNLISNALKYRSPYRQPVIKLESKTEEHNIILSITDNGLGIDLVKNKDNIFKIGKVFHRNPNAKGFGLYMTKTQVDAMNGKIWVESVPDEGTTFFIEFKNQGL